jgi:predicted RNase H-like HicB family nuclease
MVHGSTHEETVKNIKDAINLWIYTANEFGDPVPSPKKKDLSLHKYKSNRH